MSFMPWTDELATGIKKIDEHRKSLAEATSQLHAAISKSGTEHAVVGKMLRGLVDSTFKTFIQEEDLLERECFPERDAHLFEHNSFTDRITNLLIGHNTGEPLTVAAMDELKQWLTQHMAKSDKAYVPFLKQKGASAA